MSSSSNDPESPEASRWVHDEPTSIGERPPRTPVPPAPATPAAPAAPAAPTPESKLEPRKVRGVFGKQSLPPPPAGRGPIDLPTPAARQLRPPPVTGAPELPAGMESLDDPMAGLFDTGPQTVVIEDNDEPASTAEAAPSSGHDDATLVPGGDESFAGLLSTPPSDSAPVAKLGLAKTMLATTATSGAMQEIMAPEPSRDPRSEDSLRPQVETARTSLDDVVFDPDQSVARRLGEVSIDGDVGPMSESDALRDLPLPQVPVVTRPSVDPGPIDTVPVRSPRAAFVIIALVLISGGAATLMSLGVLGGSPQDFRPKTPITPNPGPALTPIANSAPAAKATPTVIAPVPAVAAPPPAVVAPVPTPVTASVVEAAPVVEPTPVKAPVATETPVDADPATQYLAALAADPRDHHAMEGLVRVYLARGEGQQAISFAEQIVKRRPKRAAYRVLLGQARSSVGDRAGARSAFQEALALEPDNRDAQRLLGP